MHFSVSVFCNSAICFCDFILNHPGGYFGGSSGGRFAIFNGGLVILHSSIGCRFGGDLPELFGLPPSAGGADVRRLGIGEILLTRGGIAAPDRCEGPDPKARTVGLHVLFAMYGDAFAGGVGLESMVLC